MQLNWVYEDSIGSSDLYIIKCNFIKKTNSINTCKWMVIKEILKEGSLFMISYYMLKI